VNSFLFSIFLPFNFLFEIKTSIKGIQIALKNVKKVGMMKKRDELLTVVNPSLSLILNKVHINKTEARLTVTKDEIISN
jgi:hypothetical protein